MAAHLLGQFIIQYLFAVSWLTYPFFIEPATVKIHASDASMENVIIEFPEIDYIDRFAEQGMGYAGIQVDDIRRILKDEHNRCFDKDELTTVPITFKRDAAVPTYDSVARGVQHVEGNTVVPARDFIDIVKGLPPVPTGITTGILPFSIPITTYACA